MKIGLPGILGLIFIVLKLTHNIDWPWLWVLSPFWISLALCLVVAILLATVAGTPRKWKL